MKDVKKLQASFRIDSRTLYFHKIFKQNNFVAFLFLKHLDFHGLTKVKKIIYPLGLKILGPKNKIFKKLSYKTNTLNKTLYSKSFFMYSSLDEGLVNLSKILEIFRLHKDILPIIFYVFNRFMYMDDIYNLLKTRKQLLTTLIMNVSSCAYYLISLLLFINQSIICLNELCKSTKKGQSSCSI